MKYEITLNLDDYLICFLYNATISKNIKKFRLFTKLILPIIMIIYALLEITSSKYNIDMSYLKYNNAIFYLLCGLFLFIFISLLQKWFFKFTIKRQIKEEYKNILGKKKIIDFNNDSIKDYQEEIEISIIYNNIDSIIELNNYLLIKNKSIYYIIIPKKQLNDKDITDIKLFLEEKTKLETKIQLNWKWR